MSLLDYFQSAIFTPLEKEFKSLTKPNDSFGGFSDTNLMSPEERGKAVTSFTQKHATDIPVEDLPPAGIPGAIQGIRTLGGYTPSILRDIQAEKIEKAQELIKQRKFTPSVAKSIADIYPTPIASRTAIESAAGFLAPEEEGINSFIGKGAEETAPTIESAVINVEGKMYEGASHAEAMQKAKDAGADISTVNRWKDGMFKTSDGRIITRDAAKKEFGINTSEEIPTQFGKPPNEPTPTPTMEKIEQGEPSIAQRESSLADRALSASKRIEEGQTLTPKEISSYNLNLNHFNIDVASKKVIDDAYGSIKPQIESIVGKPLSNQEVKDFSQKTSNFLSETIGRENTKEWESQMYNLRNEIAAQAKRGTVTKEFLDNLQVLKSQGADIARKLQSLSMKADPTLSQSVLDAVSKVAKNADEILKAAKGKDLNDPKQATEFYRTFVKPRVRDWIDKIRYNSMLSGPLTHIYKATSELLNTVAVRPIEKAFQGGIDFLSSKGPKFLGMGKEQTVFAGEVGPYLKNYFTQLGKSVKQLAVIMADKTPYANIHEGTMTPALEKLTGVLKNAPIDPTMGEVAPPGRLPLTTDGIPQKIERALDFPTRMLEGVSQFFIELTRGAEEAALKYRAERGGIAEKDIEVEALDRAKKETFRHNLFSQDQGNVLNAFDWFTKKLLEASHHQNPAVSFPAKMTVPFVKIPMELFKSGFEHGPLGLSTIWGSSAPSKALVTHLTDLLSEGKITQEAFDKGTQKAEQKIKEKMHEQMSKAIFGSSVMAGTSMMLLSGRITGNAPKGTKEKQLWAQAGKQAYSFKIGDTWISYQKMPPAISFPLAFIATLHDAITERKIDDDTAHLFLSGIAKYGKFLSDQSYVKGVGDLVNAVSGQEAGVERWISNYPQQFIPYRAFGGWLARLLDDTQHQIDTKARFIDKQMQLLMENIPWVANSVPPKLDQEGNPIKDTHNIINSFSPFKISEDNKKFSDFLNNYDEFRKQVNNELKTEQKAKKDFQPIYDQVQNLLKQGKDDEADAMVQNMSDNDYELYKKIKASDANSATIKGETEMYPIAKHAHELVQQGKQEEADKIVQDMSDEQYRIYELVSKKLGFTSPQSSSP